MSNAPRLLGILVFSLAILFTWAGVSIIREAAARSANDFQWLQAIAPWTISLIAWIVGVKLMSLKSLGEYYVIMDPAGPPSHRLVLETSIKTGTVIILVPSSIRTRHRIEAHLSHSDNGTTNIDRKLGPSHCNHFKGRSVFSIIPINNGPIDSSNEVTITIHGSELPQACNVLRLWIWAKPTGGKP